MLSIVASVVVIRLFAIFVSKFIVKDFFHSSHILAKFFEFGARVVITVKFTPATVFEFGSTIKAEVIVSAYGFPTVWTFWHCKSPVPASM